MQNTDAFVMHMACSEWNGNSCLFGTTTTDTAIVHLPKYSLYSDKSVSIKLAIDISFLYEKVYEIYKQLDMKISLGIFFQSQCQLLVY